MILSATPQVVHEHVVQQSREHRRHHRRYHRVAELAAHVHPVVNISIPGEGLPPIFANCIINAESSGNAQDPDGLYGILSSTWATLPQAAEYPGGAGTAPVSVQNQAALEIYDQAGLWAWSDPCVGFHD
jgi:hypothetical protein